MTSAGSDTGTDAARPRRRPPPAIGWTRLDGAVLLGVTLLAAIATHVSSPVLGTFAPLLSVLGLVVLIRRRAWPRATVPGAVWAGAAVVILWAWATVLWAADPAASADRTLRITLHALSIAVLTAWVLTVNVAAARRGLAYLLIGWLIAAALLAIDYGVGLEMSRLIRGATEPLPTSAMNRNLLVLTTAVFPAMVAAWLIVPPRWRKAVWALPLLACVLALPGMSLVSKIQVVAGTLVFAVTLVRPRTMARMLGAVFVGSLILVPAAFLALPEAALSRLAEIDAVRMAIWERTAAEILTQPVRGHGVDAIRSLREFAPVPGLTDAVVLHAHNLSLQIWLELGVVGILGVTALGLGSLTVLTRCPQPVLAAGLATFTAVLCTLTVGTSPWRSWYLGLISVLICWLVLCHRVAIAAGPRQSERPEPASGGPKRPCPSQPAPSSGPPELRS